VVSEIYEDDLEENEKSNFEIPKDEILQGLSEKKEA